MHVNLEALGVAQDENKLEDGFDIRTLVASALKRLDDNPAFGSVADIDYISTGLDQDVREALEEYNESDDNALDAEIERADQLLHDDDKDFVDAIDTRNFMVMNDESSMTDIDVVVAVRAQENQGNIYTKDARSHGTPVIEIPVGDLVDWSFIDDGESAEADQPSPAEAASADAATA
jgi:hypothetical protein